MTDLEARNMIAVTSGLVNTLYRLGLCDYRFWSGLSRTWVKYEKDEV
jgi:hypothetical protein